MTPRRILRARSQVVGLFGERRPYAAGRLVAYRLLRHADLIAPPWFRPLTASQSLPTGGANGTGAAASPHSAAVPVSPVLPGYSESEGANP